VRLRFSSLFQIFQICGLSHCWSQVFHYEQHLDHSNLSMKCCQGVMLLFISGSRLRDLLIAFTKSVAWFHHCWISLFSRLAVDISVSAFSSGTSQVSNGSTLVTLHQSLYTKRLKRKRRARGGEGRDCYRMTSDNCLVVGCQGLHEKWVAVSARVTKLPSLINAGLNM